ncbi:putative peptidoglycan binding protein [Roseinatronobacter thiooxidans]|uniref:Putative peptidoglycan binding protein n=1 Tax=Roseinatronobacter thiooxidans TaxID=121821 RepID=A0A2W7QAM6_9RHOB|nr:peptidoglycan-binding domain-containing protein [Roseinatronobacter thiooxidans]PZX45704.1 putative peptidoglycan binding protein [Roseinatronobacter thiooxidans]
MRNSILRNVSALTLIGALAVPSLSSAADVDGNYALRGVGSAQCSDYTAALSGNGATDAQVYIAWLAGYITARSRLADETFDVLPLIAGADVAGLMNVICTQNQDSTFESAIDAAIRLFEPARVVSDSPLLELTHDNRTVLVRQSTFEQVQSALSAQGFYTGAIDGAYGPGSRSAITAFQESRNLAQSGLPDADTLVALLLGAE